MIEADETRHAPLDSDENFIRDGAGIGLYAATGAGLQFFPEPKWEWNVFGNEPPLMMVKTPFDPPLWRRLLTRVFLGSTWKRLNKKETQL